MKVRAIKVGYYDHRRRKPDCPKYAEFELADPKHFSAKWMEKLEDDYEEVAEKSAPAPKKAVTKKPAPASKVI